MLPTAWKVGDKVVSGASADIVAGNALPLVNIPVGTFIHNVELYPGKGAQLARAAGIQAQLMAKKALYALIRLPSGELRNVPVEVYGHHRPGSATSTMRTSTSAKPTGNVTWAGDRPSAVLS